MERAALKTTLATAKHKEAEMEERPWHVQMNTQRGPSHRLSATVPQGEMLTSTFCDIAGTALREAKAGLQPSRNPRTLGAAQAAGRAAEEAWLTAQRILSEQCPTAEETRNLTGNLMPLATSTKEEAARILASAEPRGGAHHQTSRHEKASLHNATAATLKQLVEQEQKRDSKEWLRILQTGHQLANFIPYLSRTTPSPAMNRSRSLATALETLGTGELRLGATQPNRGKPLPTPL